MNKQILNKVLLEKIAQAEKSEGYFITITTFDSKNTDKELGHWYVTNKFPITDMTLSLEVLKHLIEEEQVNKMIQSTQK